MALIYFLSNLQDHSWHNIRQPTYTSTTTVIIVLIFSYFLITRFLTWRRLSAFPGPFPASISYLPMLKIRSSPQACLDYADLSNQYGSLTRIGPNDLLSSDPDHLRRMSAVRSTYERSSWYKATRLDPYHDMMGSVMDKASHMALRAKLVGGYTGRDIPDLELEIDSQIQSLVDLIRRHYLIKPLDFGRLADFYAHDARSTLAFGKPLGMLEQDSDVHGIIAIVKLALKWIQVFTDIPPLHRIFLSNTVLKLFGPKPTDNFGVGKLMGMARELVATRYGPGAEDRQDLLGSFIRHGLDRRSAESEVMFPIIAGSDTTATAIKMTVSYITSDRTISAKLNREIQDALADGRLSSSRPATVAETAELPYLQAVIWEGLRVHPPFAGLIMKEVGPQGDTFHGKFIPAGTRIGHSTWAVTHEASVFGADVDCFRPERWLEADQTRRNSMRRQTELVFGSGRWGCPGRIIAFIELNKLLVELFRNFDFNFIDAEKTSKIQNNELFMSGSLPMVVTDRMLNN